MEKGGAVVELIESWSPQSFAAEQGAERFSWCVVKIDGNGGKEVCIQSDIKREVSKSVDQSDLGTQSLNINLIGLAYYFPPRKQQP